MYFKFNCPGLDFMPVVSVTAGILALAYSLYKTRPFEGVPCRANQVVLWFCAVVVVVLLTALETIGCYFWKIFEAVCGFFLAIPCYLRSLCRRRAGAKVKKDSKKKVEKIPPTPEGKRKSRPDCTPKVVPPPPPKPECPPPPKIPAAGSNTKIPIKPQIKTKGGKGTATPALSVVSIFFLV